MKKTIQNILRVGLPMAFGGAILWWMYQSAKDVATANASTPNFLMFLFMVLLLDFFFVLVSFPCGQLFVNCPSDEVGRQLARV